MTLWPEVANAVDRYLIERQGSEDPDAPLLLGEADDRALTYFGIHQVFERLGVSAHRCRHTGVSGFHRAGSGTTLDAMREFGWKDRRMAERYDHVRPAEERLARPSPFAGFRGARRQELKPAKRNRNGLALRAV